MQPTEDKKDMKRMPDFKTVKDLIEGTSLNGQSNTTAGDILYYLMTGVLEQPISKLEEFLPTFMEDFIKCDYPSQTYIKGFSRFVQALSDLSTDVPKLPRIFWSAVMRPLFETNKLDLKKVTWLSPIEEDLFQFSGHFKIFAEFLNYRSGFISLSEAIKQFDTDFGEVVKTMLRLNEDDKKIILAEICEESGLKQDSPIFKCLGLAE